MNIIAKVTAFVATATVGVAVMPKLVKKGTAKVYKSSLRKEEINFDEMGPTIIKKEGN